MNAFKLLQQPLPSPSELVHAYRQTIHERDMQTGSLTIAEKEILYHTWNSNMDSGNLLEEVSLKLSEKTRTFVASMLDEPALKESMQKDPKNRTGILLDFFASKAKSI